MIRVHLDVWADLIVEKTKVFGHFCDEKGRWVLPSMHFYRLWSPRSPMIIGREVRDVLPRTWRGG